MKHFHNNSTDPIEISDEQLDQLLSKVDVPMIELNRKSRIQHHLTRLLRRTRKPLTSRNARWAMGAIAVCGLVLMIAQLGRNPAHRPIVEVKVATDVAPVETLPPALTPEIISHVVWQPAGTQRPKLFSIAQKSDDLIEIDFKIESGPAEGSAKGILKVDGNKAKLGYDPTGENRPEEFKTTAENGFFSFVMEKKAAKFDASMIPGTWQVIEGVRAGEEVAKDRLAEAVIAFDKDKITIPAGEDSFVMSYTINAKASPIQIELKIVSGPAPEGSPAVGILKLNNGKFVLCYNAMGGDRPESFESTEDNGNFLFVMKSAEK